MMESENRGCKKAAAHQKTGSGHTARFFLLTQQRQHTGLGAGTHSLIHKLAVAEPQQIPWHWAIRHRDGRSEEGLKLRPEVHERILEGYCR